MWAGVLVIDANEKVYHELGAVIHVQLGDDILQPPQFSWRKETAGSLKGGNCLCTTLACWHAATKACFTVFGLPIVHSNGPVIHIRQHPEQRGPSSLLNFNLRIHTKKCYFNFTHYWAEQTFMSFILFIWYKFDTLEASLAWIPLRPTHIHWCRICTGSLPWWGQQLPLPLFPQGLLQTEPGGTESNEERWQKDKEDK